MENVQGGNIPSRPLQPKTVAMKRLTLLFVLMTAPGLGGQKVVLSNQAMVAVAPTEKLDARSWYESGAEHQKINTLDESTHSKDKRLLASGPTNEGEAKRLKLIFLIMMSLGQYRTPAH